MIITMNLAAIPNSLTISRIVGVLAILWMAPYLTNLSVVMVIILYTTLCLTDYLDGWLARRFGSVSEFGNIMDPLADKILMLVFLPLLQMQVIHFFPVFLLVSREFLVMGLRVFAAKQGRSLAAEWMGKIKTAIILPVAGILFARIPVQSTPLPVWLQPVDTLRQWVFELPQPIINGLILLMVVVTILSLIDYVFRYLSSPTTEFTSQRTHSVQLIQKSIKMIPNTLTLANLGCGLMAIIQPWQSRPSIAAGLVLLGVYLDALDGRLARRLNVFSEFGAKLDSKADFVTFGVAPAVLLGYTLSRAIGHHGLWIGVALGMTHYAAVHFRLRRFDQKGHSDFFDGMPSPTGAAIVVIATQSTWLTSPFLLIPISLVVSGLMVSSLPYPHLSKALQHPLLNALKIPAFIFFFGSIVGYFVQHPLYPPYFPEGLLLCIVVYMLSPWFKRS